MTSDPSLNLPPARGTSGQQAADGTYVDWSAILAGSVIALAISFLLISFGASLGLSMTSPYRGEGVSAFWLAIAAGLWFAWVMVTGFGAGGYLAGRMRRKAGDATADEVEVRDGAHGLMVWATGAVISMILAATGVGGLVSTGASSVGSAAGAVTEAVGEAASSDYFANVLLRGSVNGPDGAPGASGTTQTRSAAENVTSSDGQTPAAAPDQSATDMSPGQPAGQDGPAVDPAVRQEIAGILVRSIANGELAERDRTYLAQLVAANTDLDEAAAQARIDEVNTEIADARAAAVDAVEQARVASVIFGFIAAATLLIGAVAAFFAATAGGRHRDDGLGFDIYAARR